MKNQVTLIHVCMVERATNCIKLIEQLGIIIDLFSNSPICIFVREQCTRHHYRYRTIAYHSDK